MFDLLNFNRNYIYNFTTPSNLGALTRDLGEIRNYHKVIMTAAKLIQMYVVLHCQKLSSSKIRTSELVASANRTIVVCNFRSMSL